MTDHKSLPAALAAFQADAPIVHKSKTAKVPTKAGGSYSYSYADLADVARAVYPLLAKHGLSFVCLPRPAEQGYELAGELHHTSGNHLSGSLPLRSGGTPQELGSSLTYMRRYLLGCLTGVVTDDDDDGQAASAPRPAVDTPERSYSPSDLTTAFGDAGLPDREARLAYVQDVLDRPVAHPSELSDDDIGKVLAALAKETP